MACDPIQANVIAITVCEAMLVPVNELKQAFAQSKAHAALDSVRAKAKVATTLAARLSLKLKHTNEAKAQAAQETGKGAVLNKFRRAVSKQMIVGKLGGHVIALRPNETPEEVRRRGTCTFSDP
jgi:hypothetical protein